MHAMILSAGFGTRLRPLTNYIPKPALPLLNIPLIQYHVDSCAQCGITKITVNIHHLADEMRQLIRKIQKTYHGAIRISYEKEILGTGGGIKAARKFFSDKTVLVLNGDVYCEFDLEYLYRKHKELGGLATLILRHDDHAEKFGSVHINEKGRIVSIPPLRQKNFHAFDSGMFTGVHFIEPELFDYFPASDEFCIVRGVYAPLVSSGAPIMGFFSDDYWNDIGTPQRFMDATFNLIDRKEEIHNNRFDKNNQWLTDSILCHRDAVVDSLEGLGQYLVIGPDCHIYENSFCSHSILLPGYHLEDATRLTHAICHPETTVQV